MNKVALVVVFTFLSLSLGQEFDDRGLLLKHKKKRPLFGGGGGGGSPCGYRSARSVDETDGKSLKVVAALGGAALGYHFGVKKGQHGGQQPIINNNIYNQNPCGPPQQSYYGGSGHQGLLGNHFGNFGGPRYGDINWDRTIRQFNRHIVRPLTSWF